MRALSIDSRYRVVRNLIPNPSFEVDLSFWRINAAYCSLARDTTKSRSGSASAHLTATSSSAGMYIASPPGSGVNAPAVTPSTAYRLRWSSMDDTGAGFRIARIEYNASRTQVGVVWSPNYTTVANTWLDGAWDFTTRSDAAYILLQLTHSTASTAVGQNLWVDNVALSPAMITQYYDGNSPSWRWDGTPNASTSRGLVFVP